MQKTKHWLMTIAVLLCSVAVSAHDFEVDGIYYYITSSTDLTVAVTYKGDYYDSYIYEYKGTVTIPSTVTYNSNVYKVTSIRENAFFMCESLTDITIPESVTSIEDDAFSFCRSLTDITISENSRLTSIGSRAFQDCSSLTSFITPESVTDIGDQAFRYCSSLTEITIPNNVTNIGEYAFSGTAWYNLQPNGMLYVGKVLYKYKGDIPESTSIEVKEGIKSIAGAAFQFCDDLTSITIPESVASIGNCAFSDCSRLTLITCQAVTPPTIGYDTFSEVNKSIPVYVPAGSVATYQAAKGWNEFTNIQPIILASGTCGDNLTWKLTDEGELYIEGTGRMTSYNLDSDVPWDAYRENIFKVFIEEGVTCIGNFAFGYCPNLTSIIIPNSVTSIGSYAFDNCSSLTTITIPENSQLMSIGDFAFYGCTGELIVNCDIPDEAFRYSGFTKVVIGESVTSIGEYAFSDCSSLTAINIPEGVTSIERGVFGYCSSLTTITLPKSVTSIMESAFSGCASLTAITIPESVIEIGGSAFWACSSLTSITIPEGVTSIGYEAFSGCSSLTSITIPEGVTSIGNYAFCQCSSLTSITCETTTPPAIGGTETFYQVDKSIPVYVPASSVEVYRSANGWREFSNIQPIILASGVCGDNLIWKMTDGYELIVEGTGEMYDYSQGNAPWSRKLSSITLPEGVTSIGNYAFYNCYCLTSITLPEGVTSIGDRAFADCSDLTSITIPESVTSMGVCAFLHCSKLAAVHISSIEAWCRIQFDSMGSNPLYGLGKLYLNGNSVTELVIPENVTSIGDHAFEFCSSLTAITFPESVTNIGNYAFYNCSGLTTITLPEGVTSIGECTFSTCTYLTSITFPESVTSIGNLAFEHCSRLSNIYCYAESVPSANKFTFDQIPSDAILYVPANAIEDYRNTAPWNNFNTIETIKIAVTSIALSHSSAQLKEGESMVLNAVVTPDNATDKTVSWTSSNPAVATVDADGTVNAMLEGTAIITATANDGSGVSALCEVTVKEKPYDVIFMVDGDVYHICSSEDVTFPEAPEKQNHTFVEWLEGDDVVLEEVDLKNNADAMLYSNAKCTNTQWGDQFTSWDVLFDKNANTFFHSEYSNKDSEDGLDHYIRVDMGEGKGVEKFSFTYTVRGSIPNYGNYSPRNMIVEGSNTENGEYTEIASLTELPSGAGAVYESPILGNGNKYRYIRFRVTETYQNQKVYEHPYFFMAEFGLKSSKKTRVYHAVYNLHSITININQYGSATYCSEYALNFSEVDGLKAYAATGYKTSTGIVTLTRVMTSQPGMGLFLKGEPSGEYAVPILESTDENSLNMLVGTLESTPVNGTSDDGQYYNYRYTIHDGDAEPMFYRVDDGYKLGAGKAYLQIPVAWMPAEAKAIAMRFDDGGTTDIEDIESGIQHSELIYDLMGRKVTHPQKSVVYIVNGKKVIW